MKNKFLLLFLFGYVLACNADDSKVERLIEEGIFEDTEMQFAKIPNSEIFISQFELNDMEQDIIGIWVLDNYLNDLYSDNYGPGIAITFLPNRYWYAEKSSSSTSPIKYIVGKWFVDTQKKLKVNFLGRISVDNNVNSVYGTDEGGKSNYYEIFSIPDYYSVFYNDRAFYWDNIPEDILYDYHIIKWDKPRFRILFGTFGSPPGDLSASSAIGNSLLNPVISDEYLVELTGIW